MKLLVSLSQVIRHYHGHLSAIYALSLHPTLDILVSCGRDSVARVGVRFLFYLECNSLYIIQVWDMRTKAQIHCLEGHKNTIADVKTQAADPEVRTLIQSFRRKITLLVLLFRLSLVVTIVQYVFGTLLLDDRSVR